MPQKLRGNKKKMYLSELGLNWIDLRLREQISDGSSLRHFSF